MSDFSIYKGLEVARIASNAQLSGAGTPPGTGAANVVSQSHTREQYMKVANLSATTSLAAEGEARVIPFAATFKTANVTPVSGAAVASNTAYSVIQLVRFSAANVANSFVVATANLSNVTVTQWSSIPFVPDANAANRQFAAGDVLAANVALTSTGTANNLVCTVDVCVEDI